VNVAILAPSPYPFVLGGAEHFWTGLQRYFNEQTRHACELVKIPTREGNLLELVRAYRQHAQADLLGFDRVMTSKYPAWAVRHPHHAVYVQHKLRGLYDTYHFCREPQEVAWPQSLRALQQAMQVLQQSDPQDNSPLLRLLDQVEAAATSGEIPEPFGRFPGPFTRHLVHELDNFALHPSRIASYTALSRTVAARADYFPAGVSPRVIYHPPRLEGFWCGSDDHLFTVSRLDGPKRVGLIVEAMRHVRADIPLLIGGTGPDEARLRELAAGDPRVRFLGTMTDAEVLDAYAHALAVPYVPYDEDYGLITIEAMRSGKPVITVSDAGGVTEFVQHGETGLCVAPDPVALAGAIDEMCGNRNRARQMGRAGRIRVAGIDWKPLAERVLGMELPQAGTVSLPTPSAGRRRPKAVVVLTFGVTPPRGGGQSRVFHLYKGLSERMDITLLCLCNSDEAESRSEVAPGLWEIRVPKSQDHHHAEAQASSAVNWVPITDIVARREIHRTPAFLAWLDQECADADVVVACHPFFASLLRERFPRLPLWLEAQDVELPLKRSMLPAGEAADALLALVESEERLAWQEADVVYACAQRDLDQLRALYGPTHADTLVVPNGFAEEEVQFVHAAQRRALKAILGLDQPLVVFLASWHGPNLEAVERVFGYARALPDIRFAIIGSAGLYFQGHVVPANVHMVGVVDEAEKQVFLSAADLAINPMSSGTGSNLKMFDYFAAGVPVLSTAHGARGIEAQAGVHYLSADIEEFLPQLVRALIEPEQGAALCEAANAFAREHHSWRAIGAEALKRLLRHLP
jgi:glycosyltransferase involved in cell wall biosynthesis